MKVVHLSYSDLEGGAAKAAYAIHRGLIEFGHKGTMYVASKLSDDPTVINVTNGFISHLKYKCFWNLEKLILKILGKKAGDIFSLNLFNKWNIDSFPEIKSADVVVLYWVGNGFLTIKQLQKIKSPIVWRYSDLWPLTGGCHYSQGCQKWTIECQQCPRLRNSIWGYDVIQKLFFSKANWKLSKNVFSVAPSTWMKKQILYSPNVNANLIQVVTTGVDHHFFSPEINRKKEEKKTKIQLLIGANNIVFDQRKGLSYIIELFNVLGDQANNYQLTIFGVQNRTPSFDLFASSYSVQVLPVISRKEELRQLYRDTDIFLCPSIEDNLPNTVLEAQACGIPVLGFDIDGLKDIIQHQHNGFLAKQFDIKSLNEGLVWLSNNEIRINVSREARKKIEENFTRERQIQSMLQVFQKAIECAG